MARKDAKNDEVANGGMWTGSEGVAARAVPSKPYGTLGFLGAWLLLLAACAMYADGWPTDNRIERWGAQLEEDEGWELLRSRFGGDEAVLVRIDSFDPNDVGTASKVLGFTDRLDQMPGVLEVVDARRLIGVWPWEGGGTDAQRALADELDLWAREPARLDVLLRIESKASPAARAALSETITGLAAQAQTNGMRLRAAGHPLVSAALDSEARRVERTFVPFLIVLAALGAWLFLRSLLLAGIALLPAATASVGARAFARAFVGPSDLILVAAGPITFVVVFAATLHIVLRFQHYAGRGLGSPHAARAARRDKRSATVLAAITTATGFGVFRWSELRSVAELGSLVAGTVLVSVPVLLYGAPALLAHARSVPASPVSGPRPWRRLAAFAVRRRTAVAALGAAVLAAGAIAPSFLRSATNGVAYFDRGHPVREQFEAIEAEGASLSSAEVLVRRNGTTRWGKAELAELDLMSRLRAVDGVTSVFGPESILSTVASGVGAIAAPALLERAGRIDETGSIARWTVRFDSGESAATSEMLSGLGEVTRARAVTFAQGADVFLTGSIPRLHAMQDSLVGTLATSLALTLFATTLLFAFVTRSLRDVAAVVAVNLAPVGVILTTAWVLGVPLDGATTMVGAVVLGLAVDNTFHLIHAAGPAPRSNRARLRSFAAVGGAATVGSISLALGFSTLLLSGFAPTARFGGLCAAGAVAAWAADTILLPALLPWRRRHDAAAISLDSDVI